VVRGYPATVTHIALYYSNGRQMAPPYIPSEIQTIMVLAVTSPAHRLVVVVVDYLLLNLCHLLCCQNSLWSTSD